MATNYSNWSKFDEEKELRSHEAKWEAESLTKDLVKNEEKLNATLSSTQASAASVASALQSKAAVEALKAQGISCGRRRVRPTVLPVSEEGSSTGDSVVSSEDIIALSSRLSNMLFEIQHLCEFLQEKSPCHRDAMKNLHRLFHLKSQVTDIKETFGKSSPDTIAPVIDGLEVNPLVSKTLTAVALSALAEGHAAFAAEVARCSLKLCGDSLLMWIARGIAFAALGNAYLCNVHLRQAKRVAPDLPIFGAATSFMDDIEVMCAHHLIKCSLDELIVKELNNFNKTHQIILSLAHVMEEDYLINTLRQLFLHNSSVADHGVSTLHMAENDGEVSPRGQSCSLDATLQQLRDKISLSSLPSHIHELFYAAQVLFLENYFRSAEVKYWSVIALLEVLTSLSSTSIANAEKHYRFMFVCSLMNIAYCQLETGRYRKQLLMSIDISVLSLRQSDPVSLCRIALSIDPSLQLRLRYGYVLEKTNRISDAIEVLQQCRDELHEQCGEQPCFVDYGDGAIFTQLFIGGNVPLPTLTPVSTKEVRARDNIEAYILTKMTKLENMVSQNSRGKHRAQSC